MKKIKIAIVDDHNLFRMGLSSILKLAEDIEVVFESANGKEFISHPKLHEIDVVLMDIQMPEMDGIVTTQYLRDNNSDLKIIILSMHDEDQFILHLMEIGANGYLLKDTDTDEVLNAIRKVQDSGIYFSDFVSRVMLRKMAKKSNQYNRIFNHKTDISDRELQVLRLICEGLTATEIGNKMAISPRTVDGHRVRMMEKLDVNNTAKLVAYAIKHNLVAV
jgi:two-component system, NarL family, response regulator DegU